MKGLSESRMTQCDPRRNRKEQPAMTIEQTNPFVTQSFPGALSP